ncbi:MAG: alcohol dehydrogenase catalytic domain-containing protein, partial [Nitrososphaerales archaeon]
MAKVLAARFYKAKDPVRVEEMNVPPIGDSDVLLDVKASGICHSDLHTINGLADPGLPPPITLGHEASGVVTGKGRDVDNVEIGNRVGVDYVLSCGECAYCLTGRDNLCDNFSVMAFNADGAWKEKIVVPMRHVHKLPENIGFPEGAILNCAVMTAYHAAKLAQVFAGCSVLVYGLGGVGINVVQWAKLFGATEIVAVDLEDSKLNLAKQKGATIAINPQDGDIVKKIRGATNGGVDVGFEVIGRVDTERYTVESVRKGGKACLIGINFERLPIHVMNDLQVPEVMVMSPQDHLKAEIPQVLKFVASGKFDLTNVVSHKIPLGDVNKGIDML